MTAYILFGLQGLFLTVILILVEITFSFDNAVINAQILGKMSRFWHQMFLTVGIVIAIFGVRIALPIAIVMLTTGDSWVMVIDQVINHPKEYSQALVSIYPQIAAFGGTFLLMLALHFFLDDDRRVVWIKHVERFLQRYSVAWAPAVISLVIILIIYFIPGNHEPLGTLLAGILGIVIYSTIQAIIAAIGFLKNRVNKGLSNKTEHQTGLVAFVSFIYLLIVDSAFSLDGVVGSFAISTDIIIIALGLGVGAFWVRSLTVYMVSHKILGKYKYLEHGAHWTVLALSIVMFVGIFWHVPEFVAGILGIVFIGSAALSSVIEKRKPNKQI